MTQMDKPAVPHAWQAVDVDGWIAHDGGKRPKGVKKRDAVEFVCVGDLASGNDVARRVKWEGVTRYRITSRAPKKEKRRKVWVIHDKQGNPYSAYDENKARRMQMKLLGYNATIYTAKLKEVTE